MTEQMTEREKLCYSKGYADGRKELVRSVCNSLEEEFYDYNSETDYYAGFDDGLKRAMILMRAEERDSDGDRRNEH